MALRVGGSEEKGFAIVGKGNASPIRFRGGDFLGRHCGPHVEGREGGFVVVAEVVEEDGVRGCGGDGDYGCGGVVGGQVGGREVQACLRGGRGQVPDSDGGVEGAGEESVGGGAEGERCDGCGVPFEVAEEGVVVRGQVADAIVFFGGGVDYGGGVVCETGEVGAVLLREQCFEVFAFFGVVELDGVVRAGG